MVLETSNSARLIMEVMVNTFVVGLLGYVNYLWHKIMFDLEGNHLAQSIVARMIFTCK